jgi:FdhD protein
MNKKKEALYQPTHGIQVVDEAGRLRQVQIVNEYPLTIKVNDKEIVTLMTLGIYPEDLVLGFLRNQRLIENYSDIIDIRVERDRETVFVKAKENSLAGPKNKMARKVVTTGCGEGTVFSWSLDKIYEVKLASFLINQFDIYGLLKKIKSLSRIYTIAGSVHTCALCSLNQLLMHVEDIGRHNAADAIAGKMWADGITGADKILYTTGRITSEIVIKSALMNIPVLLSRSGVTKMGLDIAQDLNMIIIARAKGKKFLVYNGQEYIQKSR